MLTNNKQYEMLKGKLSIILSKISETEIVLANLVHEHDALKQLITMYETNERRKGWKQP